MMKYIFSRIRFYFGHVSEESLARLISGELGSFGQVRAKLHLSRCWQCRARRDELEKAARLVVKFRKANLASCLPLDDRHRKAFVAIAEADSEEPRTSGRPFLSTNLSDGILPKMNPIFASAMVVIASSALLIFIWQRATPAVSVIELLNRAEASDRERASDRPPGVVFQQVAFRKGKASFRRSIYRDLSGVRKARRLEPAAEETAVQLQLELAGLDWAQPLSAVDYKAWRDRQKVRKDELRRTGDSELTLVTSTYEGKIARESLTVRETDFHPIRRTVELRGEETIEVAELNYAVLGWNDINDSLFEPLNPLASLGPKPEPIAAIALPIPVVRTTPLAQLMNAELRAREAMHAVGADLGEPVQVILEPHAETVQVRGLVNSPERKQELQSALEFIPNLSVQIQTVDEAASELQPRSRTSPNQVIVVDGTADGGGPLKESLLQRIPSDEERSALLDRTLGSIDLAMAHAWALRRLEERYSDPQSQLLSAASRSSLQHLVNDHTAVIQKQVADTSRSMGALMGWPEQEATATGEQNEQSLAPQTMLDTFESIETIQQEVRELLTNSSTTPESVDTLSTDLRNRLKSLQESFPTFSGQAAKVFPM